MTILGSSQRFATWWRVDGQTPSMGLGLPRTQVNGMMLRLPTLRAERHELCSAQIQHDVP